MSLHHRFHQPEHSGFTRSVDPSAARRQFNVSLGVVVALALGIGLSVVAIHPATGYDPTSQRAAIASAAAIGGMHLNAQSGSRWTGG